MAKKQLAEWVTPDQAHAVTLMQEPEWFRVYVNNKCVDATKDQDEANDQFDRAVSRLKDDYCTRHPARVRP